MIEALVLLLLAAPSLACPAGTEHRGAAPPEGAEEWCEGEDGAGQPRKEGAYREYYDDGAVRLEQIFRAGELDGPFIEHHRNGRSARTGSYAKGRREGRFTVFDESGALVEEAGWKDDFLDGPFVAHFPGGAKRTEGRYCRGAQCGRWRTFDEAGRELGAADFRAQP